MKNKLTKNLFIIILVTLVLCAFLPNKIYAVDNIISSGKDFVNKGEEQDNPIDEEALRDTSSYIYNVLFTIAVVLAFVIGMIIGIQFIMGSVDEKAKIKETLVPYVIGVFIIFSAFGIWKIIMSIGNSFEDARVKDDIKIIRTV
mgnify:FL=1